MDPIADMLTAMRNALAVKKETVIIPHSRIKFELLTILKDKGFIKDVQRKGRGVDKKIEIFLKYDEAGRPAISEIKRKSRPGQRVYIKSNRIKPIRQGFGLAIISTSRGLMSANDALKSYLGGELICEVW
ncbi:30S ribosomal protein S8 [Candidatus Parcubacteria bacterium]|nr:MAG: 30S ribosomal protein S8 [Candidatus Parcubacteria bacterium]